MAGSPRRSRRPGSRRPDRRSRPPLVRHRRAASPMLFGCCHPALAVEARLALTLRAVAGLTTAQIARAFLVPEATLAQRIVRAKRKIVANGIRYGGPRDARAGAPRRRPHGHLPHVQRRLRRRRLARPRRGRGLARRGPDRPASPPNPRRGACWPCSPSSSRGRRPGSDREGELVLLADQDRGRWDHPAIARAERYLERAAVWRRPGRFQLQAAIAACHASAPVLGGDGLAADPHPLRPAAAPRPVAGRPAQPRRRPGRVRRTRSRPSRRSRRWPAPSTHTTCGTPPGRTCSAEWAGWTRPPRRTGGRSTSPRCRPSRRSCASG